MRPDWRTRLRELIRVKLAHFAPNRGVLRALLRNGADPKHPLSPFSPQTKEIRDIDLAWFRRILVDCGMRIPRDLEPHLPGVLWFFQMGVIFFWVIDESPDQARTARLLELATKSVVFLIRVSALPLMRPLRKTALQLIEIVEGDRMSTLARCIVGLLLLAILVLAGIALLHNGIYGLTIFVVAPVVLGGVACWVFRPATGAEAAKVGALT